MINRRDLMLAGLAGATAYGFGRVNPDFLINSAFAAEGKTLRFLGAEALTGNWDPTTHTNLGQLIVEGFVFGYLTRAPMRPQKPDELVFELANSLTPIDTYTHGSEAAKGHQVPRRRAVHRRGCQGDVRIRLPARSSGAMVSRPRHGRCRR